MASAINRRELLQLLGAGTAFSALQLPAAESNAPLFFEKDDFATLERLTEIIIPSDEHSPGAREAEVAKYIDRTVAEAFDPEEKRSWRDGLALVNEISKANAGVAFLKASPEQQVLVMHKLAGDERNGHKKNEQFFGQLKETTAFVYYSSSIGIHQEIQYKGNVILEQFVGYDAT